MLILAGGLIYLDLNGQLQRTINSSLHDRAVDIEADVSSGRVAIRQEEAFAQILGPGATVVDSSAPAPAVLTPEQVSAALHHDVYVDRRIPHAPALGQRARLLAHPSRAGDRTLVIVVGASLDAVIRGRERLALILALLSPLLGVLLSVGGWLLAGAALRPVRRMSQEADVISLAQAGRRLAEPAGEDEIAQLGRTLNAMLDRIEAAFARERMFLDDASHELRTPIAVLRAELEVALLDLSSEKPLELGDRAALERSLRSALEEAERLAHLAEDLLVLARATAGRLPLRRRPVDVRALAEDAARRGTNGASGKATPGVTVAVDGPVALAVVDPARLDQVITNLVGNARRFARRRVQVGVSTDGEDVIVTVADDGPGFPAALLPVAFDRFTRAEAARSHDAGAGAGLGLAIVAAIVRAHGGSISAGNGPPLGGAAVVVRLPLDETGPVPEPV
ncbi:MAG: HAMP domain-containing protein [Actinobacteria bacterium]|nr:HAMP domain-containing protein [Actinomycetota bacterium]